MAEEITAQDIELNTCAMLTALWYRNEEALTTLLNDMDEADLAAVAVRTGNALLSFLAHEHKIGVGGSVPERIRESARKATDDQLRGQ